MKNRNYILEKLYKFHSSFPGEYLAGRKIAQEMSFELSEVYADALYFKDKGFISLEEYREIGRSGIIDFKAQINHTGIDYIENLSKDNYLNTNNGIYEYDIALSFAGEDREYVAKVADFLQKNNVTVFYDEYREADLWGADLYTYLDEIYRKKSKFCLMFISRYYREKLWSNHERQSAQARAFKDNEVYILPAIFDDTEIPGMLPTKGYIDLRKKSLEEFEYLIIEKLKKKS